MKVFIITNSGVEHNSILGIYQDREKAEKDLDLLGEEKNRTSSGDETFQERWIKIEGVWYRQTRHKYNEEAWPEWLEFDREASWYTDRLSIQEYETEEFTLQDKVNAINEWQNTDRFHPLTCITSNHPNLVPHVNDYPTIGVGLRCIHPDCDWEQDPDHSVLQIVYASYIRNRSQTS